MQTTNSSGTGPQKALLLSKSYKAVLKKVEEHFIMNDYASLEALMKQNGSQILKRASLGLLHYSRSEPNQQSKNKLFDAQNPLKWADKDIVTFRIANELILKLSMLLNLDEAQTFDILDVYFQSSDLASKHLTFIQTLDQTLTRLENPQQNPLQNQMLNLVNPIQMQFQNNISQIENYTREFIKKCNEICGEAQQLYFEERIALLKILLKLLVSFTSSSSRNPNLQAIKSELFDRVDIFSNIISSLSEHKKYINLWLQDLQNPRNMIVALQQEELLMIQCMLKLNHQPNNLVEPSAIHLISYLEYLQATNFQGAQMRPVDYQADKTIQYQRDKIVKLSLLNALNMLSIHRFTTFTSESDLKKSDKVLTYIRSMFSNAEDSKKLIDTISNMTYTEVKVPIIVVFCQIIKLIQKHDLAQTLAHKAQLNFQLKIDDLKQINFMEFIKEVCNFNTEVFDQEIANDRQGELNIIIQDFINLTFALYKALGMEDEMIICQDLTFSIIQKPVHLQYIWSTIKERGDLIGAIERPRDKLVYHTLDIFEQIIEKPIENFTSFAKLLSTLCGSKHQSFEFKVHDLLKSMPVDLIIREFRAYQDRKEPSNMLQLLIDRFQTFTQRLEDKNLSSHDYFEYAQIASLLAKLIDLNPLLYFELRDEFMDLNHDLNPDSYVTKEPLLELLCQSLIGIIFWENSEQVQQPFVYLMKAICQMYSQLDFQREILYLFTQHIGTSDRSRTLPLIIQFYQWIHEQQELVSYSYPFTIVYLDLLHALIAKDSKILPVNQYLEKPHDLDNSILDYLLTEVYCRVIDEFKNLVFQDTKEFFKLYSRLLKLTKTLLKYFQEILPEIKAPLCSRFPQYDELLRLFSMRLSQCTSIEQLIINALLLQEGHSKGVTIVSNTFWVQQLESGSLQEIKLRPKIQTMIKNALSCFNILLDLSLLNSHAQGLNNEQLMNISSKIYYISTLSTVTNVTNLVKSPGAWEQYPLQNSQRGVTYSIFNIVQYYIRPSNSLSPYITGFQIKAIEFFTKCCQIWETQTIQYRVSLESVLRTTGMTSKEVKQRFISTFKICLKQYDKPLNLKYLAVFLDFLVLSSSSQMAFLEDLFRSSDFQVQFLELLNKDLSQQLFAQGQYHDTIKSQLVNDIESKCVILLSLMSQNQVAEESLKKNIIDNDIINKRIGEQIIRKIIKDANKLLLIDYDGRQMYLQADLKEQQANNIVKASHIYSKCQALITLGYFMKFIQNEYSKNPNSLQIRKAVTQLFNNQDLFIITKSRLQVDDLIKEVVKANEQLDTYDGRIKEDLQILQNLIYTGNKLTNDHFNLLNSQLNKLVMGEQCGVRLLNLNAQQLMTFYQSNQAFKFLLGGYQLTFKTPSMIGANLMINVEEVISVARSYLINDNSVLSAAATLFAQYNLHLSTMLSQHYFTQQLTECMTGIGQSRMRENLKNKDIALTNRSIALSMINLITNDDINVIAKNNNALKGLQNDLANKLVSSVAKPLVDKILGQGSKAFSRLNQSIIIDSKDETVVQISFESAQNEADLDLLCVTLGAINNISILGEFPQDLLNKIQNELISNLIKTIPKLRNWQMPYLDQNNFKETSNIIRLQNEKTANQLFIHLVLQTLSLAELVHQQSQQRNMSSLLLDKEYVQILSQTVKVMTNYHQNFIVETLNILQLGQQLLSAQGDNEVSEYFAVFMKRQESNPLRAIIQTFGHTQTTIQEKIKIVEWMTNYARNEFGAQHLVQENICICLGISQLITQVSKQDFYLIDPVTSDQLRNPLHILWCHVLLLLRTVNATLLHDLEFRSKLIHDQLAYLAPRITPVLQFGQIFKETRESLNAKQISLALFEEIDLITGLLQQYMEHCEEFAQFDYQMYADLKNMLLFGVIHYLSSSGVSKSINGFMYNSSTEQFIHGFVHDKLKDNGMVITTGATPERVLTFNGLDLVFTVEKIRIMLNLFSSLLNIMLVNPQCVLSELDLINNWDQVTQYRQTYQQRMGLTLPEKQMKSISKPQSATNSVHFGTEQGKGVEFLIQAQEFVIESLEHMSNVFRYFVVNEGALQELFKDVYGFLQNDDFITSKDYLGMNQFFVGQSFKELMENFYSSLEMGALFSVMIIQYINDKLMQNEHELSIGYITQSSQIHWRKWALDNSDQVVKLLDIIAKDAQLSKDTHSVIREDKGIVLNKIKEVVGMIKAQNQNVDHYY